MSARAAAAVLAAHRLIGARCRCGFDPRLDHFRYELHVAEYLAADGVDLPVVDQVLAGADDAVQRLAKRLLDADIVASLDILGKLADGSLRLPFRGQP